MQNNTNSSVLRTFLLFTFLLFTFLLFTFLLTGCDSGDESSQKPVRNDFDYRPVTSPISPALKQ